MKPLIQYIRRIRAIRELKRQRKNHRKLRRDLIFHLTDERKKIEQSAMYCRGLRIYVAWSSNKQPQIEQSSPACGWKDVFSPYALRKALR